MAKTKRMKRLKLSLPPPGPHATLQVNNLRPARRRIPGAAARWPGSPAPRRHRRTGNSTVLLSFPAGAANAAHATRRSHLRSFGNDDQGRSTTARP